MATGAVSKSSSFVRRRPIVTAVGTIAIASYIYAKTRQVKLLLPDGEIWLDMDLSQPLATVSSPPGLQQLLDGARQPLALRDVVNALEMATEDDRVVGLLGRFNYDNWDTVALACTQELRDAICKFRASADKSTGVQRPGMKNKNGRFTMAVTDSFGEGGSAVAPYYLASAFEKIFIQRSGYVGLTGIGSETVFIRRFLDRYGIKPEIFAREEYKSAAQSLSDTKFTEANRDATLAMYQGLLDDVVGSIVVSRGYKSKAEVYEIMNDCPMQAEDALARNLVDGIMYPHDVQASMARLFWDEAPKATEATPQDLLASQPTPGPTRVPMSRYIQYMRAKQAEKQPPGPQKIVVIEVAGTIARTSPADGMGPASSARGLCQILEMVKKAPDIGAVVLRVESGGGSAVASDTIAASIRSVRDAGKPVVCSMGNVAASGGYMIAAACDEIVAQPTTITGSIGVVGFKLSPERFLESCGFDVDSVHVGGNEITSTVLREFTPAHTQFFDDQIDKVYQDFLVQVAKSRNLTIEKVREVARGRVWTGRQAQEVGLVDHLGGLRLAIDRTRKIAGLPEDTPTVIYPAQLGVSAVLKAAFRRRWGRGTDDDNANNVLHPNITAAITEALFGAGSVAAISDVVTLFSSLKDIMEGRVPSAMRERSTSGAVEVKMDDDEVWR